MTKFKRGEHPALFNVRQVLAHLNSREAFFERVGRFFPSLDERYKLIEKAYDYVDKDFQGISREDGADYSSHCRAAALISLDYMRCRNHNVIIAALMHDALEDIPHIWPMERIIIEFGLETAKWIQFVTKESVENFNSKEERNILYHGRFHSAPREVFYIKLPDRLHNLLTIWACSPEKIQKQINETRRSYVGYAAKHCMLIHELAAALEEIENSFEEMCNCELKKEG